MSYEYNRRVKEPRLGVFLQHSYPKQSQVQPLSAEHLRFDREFSGRMVYCRSKGESSADDLLEHLLQGHSGRTQEERPRVGANCQSCGRNHDRHFDDLCCWWDMTLFPFSLVYAIMEIARNPRVERNCLQEIRNVWNDEKSVPDPHQFKYLTAVFTEALRLYPPLPGMVRTLTHLLKVGEGKSEYELPVDTYTYMPFVLIHRDERNFPRPTELLPER